MKMCSTCNRELAADDFYANAATKDGRDTVCHECRNRGVNLARLSRRVATWRPGMRKTREEYLAELEALRARARAVPVAPELLDYVARLARGGRQLPRVRLDARALAAGCWWGCAWPRPSGRPPATIPTWQRAAWRRSAPRSHSSRWAR